MLPLTPRTTFRPLSRSERVPVNRSAGCATGPAEAVPP
jgi:hypothetical protein